MSDRWLNQSKIIQIISKSKKILGYTFITDNILPQKSYIDENYKFENQCEKCERINMTENENIFYFIPKRITEEGIKNLKDVNKTYEFYDEYREIVINKKVAQIIRKCSICKILPCYFR